MKSRLALFLLLGAFAAIPLRADDTAGQKIYADNVRGTVLVFQKNDKGQIYSHGSGWVVDRDARLVITNHHVVFPKNKVYVHFPDFREDVVISERSHYKVDKAIEAQVLDSDPKLDLAVIQLQSLPKGAKALKRAAKAPSPGERLHLIGNPGVSAGYFVYSNGNVRQVLHRVVRYPGQTLDAILLETSLVTNPGDSGGPVFNDKGEVVGTNSGMSNIAKGIYTFTVDVRELGPYLDNVRVLMNPKTAPASAFYMRGMRRAAQSRWQDAEADFTQTLQADPKHALAYSNRGRARVFLNRPSDALKDCAEASRLDPKLCHAHYIRGLAHNNLKKYDDAIADFNRAIELDPNSAPAFLDRGFAYFQKQNWDQAIREFDEAIRLDPDYGMAYSNLGVTYLRKNQLDRALEEYNKAVSKGYTPAFKNRGDLYLNRGQLVNAAADYEEAVKSNPRWFDLRLSLAQVYYKNRDYQKSLFHANQAVSLNTKSAPALQLRGEANELLNNSIAAHKDYVAAIQLDPKLAGRTKEFDQRYIQIRNVSGKDLRAFLKYEVKLTDGSWKWYGPINFQISNGRDFVPAHDNWQVKGRAMRFWTETTDGKTLHKERLWNLVTEGNYRSMNTGYFTLTLNP